jgi:hypothetical protein
MWALDTGDWVRFEDAEADKKAAVEAERGARAMSDWKNDLIDLRQVEQAHKEEYLSRLRDHFAGQALAGYLASFAGMDDTADATHAAAQAYRYSDAMLKARQEPEHE